MTIETILTPQPSGDFGRIGRYSSYIETLPPVNKKGSAPRRYYSYEAIITWKQLTGVYLVKQLKSLYRFSIKVSKSFLEARKKVLNEYKL